MVIIITLPIIEIGATKNAIYDPKISFSNPVMLKIITNKILLIVVIKPIAKEAFWLKVWLTNTIKVGKPIEIKKPDIDINIKPFSLSIRPNKTHKENKIMNVLMPLTVPTLLIINPPKNLPNANNKKNIDA